MKTKLAKETLWVLACGMILCVGILALLPFSRPSPLAPTIDFIEFRQTSTGTVAVFRARNHCSRSFAYHGKSASDPRVYFLIAEQDRWGTYQRLPTYSSAAFTLRPNSSVDFLIPCPTAVSTSQKPLVRRWVSAVAHPTQSAPPQSPDSFGIVMTFHLGDPASVLKGEHLAGNRVRTALMKQMWSLQSAGWIQKSTCERVVGRLALGKTREVFWVESSPANPQ